MLTYDEIINVEFPKSTFGGYKSDSVDDYIDAVAETVKALLEQIKNLSDKVNDLSSENQSYKDTESSIHAALMIAQETSQKLITESTEKADKILKDAEEKAGDIVSDAENKAQEIIHTSSADSSELLKKSKEKASEILKEALVKANSITTKAKENCAAEEARYEELKKKVSDFRTSMLLLYKSHVELLNEMRPNDDRVASTDCQEKNVQTQIETVVESDDNEADFDETEVVNEFSCEAPSTEDEIEEVDLNKISFSDFSDASDDKEIEDYNF